MLLLLLLLLVVAVVVVIVVAVVVAVAFVVVVLVVFLLLCMFVSVLVLVHVFVFVLVAPVINDNFCEHCVDTLELYWKVELRDTHRRANLHMELELVRPATTLQDVFVCLLFV